MGLLIARIVAIGSALSNAVGQSQRFHQHSRKVWEIGVEFETGIFESEKIRLVKTLNDWIQIAILTNEWNVDVIDAYLPLAFEITSH